MPIPKIYLLSIICVVVGVFESCSYSRPAAKKMYSNIENRSFDVVVVPGVPFTNGKWSRTMKGRVYWAKFLFDKGIAKNIMFSGGAVQSPYVEAEIMAMYAQQLHIPTQHIFTETLAEHSTENVYYSYKKAQKLGFNSVAVASDPFQTKQLQKFIRKKVSPDIAVIPFVIDTLKMLEPNFTDPIVNYSSALQHNFIPLKKRENFWKRLRGTLGKNIQKDAYN